MVTPLDQLSLPGLARPIHVVDVGAAYINYLPPYKALLDLGLARLSAFEPDPGEVIRLREVYGANADIYPDAIADGAVHTLYLCEPSTGMTSILKPNARRLDHLTNFWLLRQVKQEMPIQTRRLDDIAELAPIDFLKMDIQGAELMALNNATAKIAECVAIQTEICFLDLYENQATFGVIDTWMKVRGFVPHTMPELVKWAYEPHVPRPALQLLYGDIVYVRDPARLDLLSDEQIRRLAHLAAIVFGTRDFAEWLLRQLAERNGV